MLQCASARIDINLWESLRRWQFEPGQLTVRGLHLVVVRRADGGIGVMGLAAAANQTAGDIPSGGVLEQWLQHQERPAIKDSSMEWRDLRPKGQTLQFTAVNLQLRNQDDRHRLDGTVDLPSSLGKELQVAADVCGAIYSIRSHGWARSMPAAAPCVSGNGGEIKPATASPPRTGWRISGHGALGATACSRWRGMSMSNPCRLPRKPQRRP